jgi:hypothetical protein
MQELAKLNTLQKSNPAFIKAARRSSSDKPENLEQRRIDFEQEGVLLKALIAKIQTLNEQALETKDQALKGNLEAQIAAYSNMANLKGLAGLYDGFGLLSELLSFRVPLREERKPYKLILTAKGEKIYIRVPLLDALCSELENVEINTRVAARIIKAMALKQQAIFERQAGTEIEPEKEPAQEVLAEAAPAGVPESELSAAAAKPTEAQVEKFVKGEAK